jgi:acyl-coenzyme A synthetase/AMP-(fatty) acid ligase
MVPGDIRFVEELPRLPSTKLDRNALRECIQPDRDGAMAAEVND